MQHDYTGRDADKRYADDVDVVGDAVGVCARPFHPSRQLCPCTLDDGGRHRVHCRAISVAIHLRIPTDGCDAGCMLQPGILHPGNAALRHGHSLCATTRAGEPERMDDGWWHLRAGYTIINRCGADGRHTHPRGIAPAALVGICGFSALRDDAELHFQAAIYDLHPIGAGRR